MTILLSMLAMLFSKTFSKLRERLTESGDGGCRVRNVKVHCFIEENGEKLFGRADAKLSNSLLVEKIRRVSKSVRSREQKQEMLLLPCCLHRIYILNSKTHAEEALRLSNRGRTAGRACVLSAQWSLRRFHV